MAVPPVGSAQKSLPGSTPSSRSSGAPSHRPGPAGPINNQTVYREACKRFLPMTREEMKWRGWDELDVLLVTGDAYVDHPSFGIPCLGRSLEKLGLRVGIVCQPKWDSTTDFLRMGRPRLFVGVSSGTVDSMINNYTANKKPRTDDMYSEGGRGGNRPDFASIVYSDLAKQAFPDLPVIVGGVESSLRRLAHYDYWQNRVRPSILTELKAEFMVFGMGEKQTHAWIEKLLEASKKVGGPLKLSQPETQEAVAYMKTQRGVAFMATKDEARALEGRLTIPSFEEVRDDKKKFAKAAYFIEYEASPYNGKRLVQYHGSKAVVINPPALPLSTEELDAVHEMPFTKEQHPSYKERIPAADMIRFSIASTRGCYGGCSFCAITLHQGRIVQSRSEESLLKEVAGLNQISGFKGQVSDIGGPTANMYQTRCKSKEIQSMCRKLSCVHPKVCPQLQRDHAPQVSMLRKARAIPGIKKITIASGLRYDLSLADDKSGQEYMKELITHHVGGHLKVAPEHLDDEVLHLMKKPGLRNFDEFVSYFDEVSREAGKKQYVVPYFISGFPGTTHEKMEKVYDYLKSKGWNLQQVQAFIPTPMTLATAMYHTGIDPMSKKNLFVAKEKKDRKIQQALLQPHKPQHKEVLENYMRGKRKDVRASFGHGGHVKMAKPSFAGSSAMVPSPKSAGWKSGSDSRRSRDEIVGGVKFDYGTGDSRVPVALQKKFAREDKRAHSTSGAGGKTGGHGQRRNDRSIVEPPKGKLGRKLYLDSR